MSSETVIRADRPPEFDEWPFEQQVDWVCWNLDRPAILDLFLNVLDTDPETTSDRVTVTQLVDAVELITDGQRVISARCDRDDCVRIFREEIDAEARGDRVTAEEMARFILKQ